jgi:hypothetical protein
MVEFRLMNKHLSTHPVITLMTDFGLDDPYVGVMKGVILSIVSQATLVDLTHAIGPQAVHQAAFLLSTAIRFFPAGTIHLVVVDPGVGSTRRPIAVQTERAFYVAPDNGVLTLALAHQPVRTVVHLTDVTYWLPTVRSTFHGRDIFAPVAAHLARGIPIHDLGTPIDDWVRLPASSPARCVDGNLVCQIQHIDHFGNCITNVPFEMLDPEKPVVVRVAGQSIPGLATTYSIVEPGQVISLVGSHGFLEIAIRNGNAAEQLRVTIGDPVTIERQ